MRMQVEFAVYEGNELAVELLTSKMSWGVSGASSSPEMVVVVVVASIPLPLLPEDVVCAKQVVVIGKNTAAFRVVDKEAISGLRETARC